MTIAQTAFTGRTGARPITAVARRIARDLEARVADAVPIAEKITDKAELFRVAKQAAIALGLGIGARETLEHLIGYTRLDDWRDGRTPIVWPSNLTLAEMAGRTVGAIKARLRQLRLAGLVLARDSAHGRRAGRRDGSGAISCAFGLDLSPLRVRFAELKRLADAYTACSRLFNEGRQEIARVRRLVGQAIAQAADLRLQGAHWPALEAAIAHVAGLASAARQARDADAYRAALDRLAGVEQQVADTVDRFMFPDELAASGSKNHPDIQIQTNPSPFSPVKGDRDGSPDPAGSRSSSAVIPDPAVGGPSRSRFRAGPADLMELFPAIAGYVASPRPRWGDLHAAAGRLRHDLGIRVGTYLEALDRLGADGAAVAVMVVAERHHRGEIRQTAGAYFAGMVAKAKRDELDLARSLWGFRTEQADAGYPATGWAALRIADDDDGGGYSR